MYSDRRFTTGWSPGAAEAPTIEDMTKPFPPGTFNFVDLVAKDISAARTFYEPLFGWTYVEQDTHGGPPYGMFLKDGKSAAGIGQMSKEMIDQGVPSTWNTYVSVDDIKAAEAKIRSLGGTLMFDTIDVFDAGRMTWAQDSEGAVFALWQPQNHAGSEITNVPGSFCWNERATRDLSGVKAFYGELFGWTFKDEDAQPMSMIHNQGREMGHAIVMSEQWGPVPPHWNVYFAVSSCDDCIAQAERSGGAKIMGPIDIPAGRFSMLKDPNGAMFYVIQLSEIDPS